MEGRTQQDLPIELWLEIFKLLTAEELDAVVLTCARFHDFVFGGSLRQYSPLDYTKRNPDKDHHYCVPVKPGLIVPMTNESIIMVDEFMFGISLIELGTQVCVTTIYSDERDDDAVSVDTYTKVSSHLFAYLSGVDMSQEGDERTLYLWNTTLKKCIKTWAATSPGCYKHLLVIDNALVLAGGNKITFWDLNDLNKDEPIKTVKLAGFKADIFRLFINQKNQFVVVDDKQCIHLYNKEGKLLTRMNNIPARANALQLLPNDTLFGTCHYNTMVCVIDLEEGEIQKQPLTRLPGVRESSLGGKMKSIAHTSLVAMSYNRQDGSEIGTGVTFFDAKTLTCIGVLDDYLLDYGVMPDNRIGTIFATPQQIMKGDECNLYIRDFEPLILQSSLQQEESSEEEKSNEEVIGNVVRQAPPTSEHSEHQSKEKPTRKKSSFISAATFFTHKGSSKTRELAEKTMNLTRKVFAKKSPGNT